MPDSYFNEPIETGLWAVLAEQHAPYTANDYRQTTDKLMFKHVISTLR